MTGPLIMALLALVMQATLAGRRIQFNQAAWWACNGVALAAFLVGRLL